MTSKKEFDKYVDENIHRWLAEFTIMILDKRNWDLTFDEFVRYNLWKDDCEEEIDNTYNRFVKEFPEDNHVTREDVAHDLYLITKEDFEKQFNYVKAQA